MNISPPPGWLHPPPTKAQGLAKCFSKNEQFKTISYGSYSRQISTSTTHVRGDFRGKKKKHLQHLEQNQLKGILYLEEWCLSLSTVREVLVAWGDPSCKSSSLYVTNEGLWSNRSDVLKTFYCFRSRCSPKLTTQTYKNGSSYRLVWTQERLAVHAA